MLVLERLLFLLQLETIFQQSFTIQTTMTLKAEDTIISAASCTTNCLAPMADALNEYAAAIQSWYHV